MKKTLCAALIGFLLGTATVGAQVASHFAAANGEQGNPSYSFLNDPTTGIYNSGSGRVSITSNNSLVGTFLSTGLNIPGALTVTGTTTLTGAQTLTGDLTLGGRLVFSTAASKIVPGATSISHRNNADSADNLLIADNGDVTILRRILASGSCVQPCIAFASASGSGLALTGVGTDIAVRAGSATNRFIVSDSPAGVTITAGLLTFTATNSQIVPGATNLSFRNTANSADNILIADAGTVTLRLALPDGSGGTGLVNAQGTVTTNGTAVANGVTQAQPGLTVTGLTTASACMASVPTSLPATWQTGIEMKVVVTAGTATLNLTNPTAASITPVAQAVNIKCIL